MKNTKRYEKQTRVMKRAWANFKNTSNWESSFSYVMSFSECLKESWEIENIESISKSISGIYSVTELFNIIYNNDIEFENILETVVENSIVDYKISIAKNGLKYKSLSTKQAWSMAYEFKNIA